MRQRARLHLLHQPDENLIEDADLIFVEPVGIGQEQVGDLGSIWGRRSDEPPFSALSSLAMSAVEAASAMDDSSESNPNALRPTAFAFCRNTEVVCSDVLKSGLISDKSAR